MTDTDAREEEGGTEEMVEKRHRENMDALTVKVLVALNGGGSIALLTFASKVMRNEVELQSAAFAGILFLIAGLALAVLFNIFRRKCSRNWQDREIEHPERTCTCLMGHGCQAFSVVLFVLGAVCVPIAHYFW